MAILSARQKMGAAALVMGISVLLSRFMGLARDKVISWQFGAAGESDIYFAAFVVPDFINYLLAGGYMSITLIPLLNELFEEDEEEGWRFFGTVFTWATLAILTLAVLGWLAASPLARLVAPGFSPDQQIRLAHFLRIVLPAQIFFLPGACISALLYIRRQFVVPALMPLIYNGFILLGGIILPRVGLAQGMEGFCWGVLAGAFIGAFLLPLLAVREGGFTFRPGLRHPRLGRLGWLALPLIVGQSVVVLDEQFMRIFGSLAGEGAVSLLNYARRVMMVPVGVVAQAAGVASFPFLASLAAKKAWGEFDGALGTALRSSMIVVVPMTAWLLLVSPEVLGLIFEGGRFSPEQTNAAAPLLRIMLLSVPFWALQQVTGRAFYARQDTLTPAVVGTLATLAALPAYLWLLPRLGGQAALGVAGVAACSVALYAVALALVACRRWGFGAFEGVAASAVRSFILSLPALLLAWGAVFAVERAGGTLPLLARQFVLLAVSGFVFVLGWGLTARFFAPEYLHIVSAPLLRRLRKGGQRAGR